MIFKSYLFLGRMSSSTALHNNWPMRMNHVIRKQWRSRYLNETLFRVSRVYGKLSPEASLILFSICLPGSSRWCAIITASRFRLSQIKLTVPRLIFCGAQKLSIGNSINTRKLFRAAFILLCRSHGASAKTLIDASFISFSMAV